MTSTLTSLLGAAALAVAAVVALVTKGFSVARLLMPARTVDTVDMALSLSSADLDRGPTSLRLVHPFAGIDPITWAVEGVPVSTDVEATLGHEKVLLRIDPTPDACLVSVRRSTTTSAPRKPAPAVNILGTDARNRAVVGHLTLALSTAPEKAFVVSIDGALV